MTISLFYIYRGIHLPHFPYMACHFLQNEFVKNKHGEKMWGLGCTIYFDLYSMLHQVSISYPTYYNHSLIIHVGNRGIEQYLIHRNEKSFIYFMVEYAVLVLPDIFAVYMNGKIS
jgi:hypothetical protein